MIKNLDPHHQANTYHWEGVMEFLYNQYQNGSQKENLWALQRDSLKEHIKELQGKLLGIQNINKDLKNRNSMLEYSLRQFKANQSQKHQKQNDEQDQLPKMPQRRPKPNKIHLTKILCSLGIPNLLEDIKKDLQNKPYQNGLHLDLNKLQAQSFSTKERKMQLQSSSQSQIKFQQLKPALTGHQDGVRDICFINKEMSTQMISVSEDCTMKIWNVNKKQNRVVNLQCKGTIRQHAGPIFTCTEGDGFVFTAGMEGIIRVYDFNKQNKPSSQKSLSLKFKHNQNQKLQPIWQLIYDKPRKLLIATSSQMEIKGYKCNQKNGKMSLDLSSKFQFKSSQDLKEDQDEYIPTAICLKNDSLYASYFNSDCIVQFDLETNKIINKINSQMEQTLSANRLISHPRCLIGAYQDFKVRLFDQNKLVKQFRAHDGPVMSASLVSNYNYFFTCGHDGFVKLWDIRKCETVLNILAHQKKHDQSIHCITTNFDNLTVSGGADSIIKVFHQVC